MRRQLSALAAAVIGLLGMAPLAAQAAGYQLYVSNERSDDVTVIDGGDFHVVATIPAGKRPRGIHASPDGRTVYVALSGTPPEPPPKLDANGNPILKKQQDDDDDDKVKSDKSADGIGVIDVASGRLTAKLKVGSDPEEFSLSGDGSRIYVSNEDIKTASVVNIAANKVEHLIPVGREPEGVTTAPDGKSFWVTCEAGGDIYVISTADYKTTAQFKVAPRPRAVDFQPGTHIGFITSESAGQLNVIDTATPHLLQVVQLPAGMRPMKVKVSPDGGKVYFTTGRGGSVGILDGHSYQLIGSIKVGARPWGLAISPDGRYLFTANGPSNDVSVVDIASGKEVTRVKAGSSPWGLTVVKTAP